MPHGNAACAALRLPSGRRSRTYIRGRALVSAGAGEGDELMAPLVHDEAADCKERRATASGERSGTGTMGARSAGNNRGHI